MAVAPSASGTAPQRLAALTGATGFIGRHAVAALAEAGWRVRLLLRREPPPAQWPGQVPEVVSGSLADEAALARLVEGADAVIHLAGLIKAARRRKFMTVNRDGAQALARATRQAAPHAHFVLVSSLAAREPQLSDYAASKRAGEDAVRDVLGTAMTVVRPPVVYGPGDRETLLFFRLAGRRRIPLLGPPAARAALIHAEDLARLLVAVAAGAARGMSIEPSDGRPQGYRWDELLGAAARALGNSDPRFFQVPAAMLGAVARIGDVARLVGQAGMVNSQKLRELRHPDWSVSPAGPQFPPGWAPRFDLGHGFADAVAWYRDKGWLPKGS